MPLLFSSVQLLKYHLWVRTSKYPSSAQSSLLYFTSEYPNVCSMCLYILSTCLKCNLFALPGGLPNSSCAVVSTSFYDSFILVNAQSQHSGMCFNSWHFLSSVTNESGNLWKYTQKSNLFCHYHHEINIVQMMHKGLLKFFSTLLGVVSVSPVLTWRAKTIFYISRWSYNR
jgi:hypothetical protein